MKLANFIERQLKYLNSNKQKQNMRYIILDLLNLPRQIPGIKTETMTTLPNKNGKLGFKTTYQL